MFWCGCMGEQCVFCCFFTPEAAASAVDARLSLGPYVIYFICLETPCNLSSFAASNKAGENALFILIQTTSNEQGTGPN